MPDFSDWTQQIEIIGVFLSFVYLYLVIKENKWCWWFGIAGSAVSIFLFVHSKLYAEALLYSYYVGIGFYGLWLWTRKNPEKTLQVSQLAMAAQLKWIGIGVAGSLGLGYFLDRYTDADKAYLDSTTTIFSFIASYFEAKKYLSAWTYWILINAVTIFLYFSKGLHYYAGMQVIYTVFSVVGYYQWEKQLSPVLR